MRFSANTLIFVFTTLGILFVVLAIRSVENTIWNFRTIIFMLLATMEFVYAIRLFNFQQKIKNAHNKKK